VLLGTGLVVEDYYSGGPAVPFSSLPSGFVAVVLGQHEASWQRCRRVTSEETSLRCRRDSVEVGTWTS